MLKNSFVDHLIMHTRVRRQKLVENALLTRDL